MTSNSKSSSSSWIT